MTLTLNILEAGKGWVAVEKPSDISVHNNPGQDLQSTLSEMVKNDKALTRKISFDGQFGLHPVHRLDLETSGIILFACRKEVLTFLGKQFESGDVIKRYTALVHGLFQKEEKEGWQTWNTPLTKKAGGRNDPAGKGQLVHCETRFRVIDNSEHYSLIDIELLTGRKHQIRRHAKISRHPVVCDPRYGSPRSIQFLAENRNFHRLGLHAYSLSLTLPESEALITFTTQQVPSEIIRLLDEDRQGPESQ